jgi:hypothetical protein
LKNPTGLRGAVAGRKSEVARWHCGGKLFSALIFFGSFLHQGKKEQRKNNLMNLKILIN